jgi:hypothetical protein
MPGTKKAGPLTSFIGARGGIRTHTGFNSHKALNLACLPISPPEQQDEKSGKMQKSSKPWRMYSNPLTRAGNPASRGRIWEPKGFPIAGGRARVFLLKKRVGSWRFP